MPTIGSINTTTKSFIRYLAKLTHEEIEEHVAGLTEQEKKDFRFQAHVAKLTYTLNSAQRADMVNLIEAEMARMAQMN